MLDDHTLFEGILSLPLSLSRSMVPEDSRSDNDGESFDGEG